MNQKMDEDILVVKHLSKYFSGVKALNDVSLAVRRGEIHAICGENGAGKSTFIKLLTGAIQPTDGEIYFNGEKLERLSPGISFSKGIRVIYQELTLIPYLTVAENLFLGREITKGLIRDSKKMNDITSGLCEDLGVSMNPITQVSSLGIAQQQIVEILKAISLEASLFIMDEPTAALTVNETKIFFGIIKKLRENGSTIIFISHRIEEIFDLADRVTVLTDGKLIATKNTGEVNRKQLISYMVGRELGESYPAPAKEAGDYILSVENLVNDKLHNISFNIKRGEILGFGGLVGAGRTELARAIFGADRILSGVIKWKGYPYIPTNPKHALKNGIGLLPEDRKNQGLVLELSVGDNITFSILERISNLIIKKDLDKYYCNKYIQDLQIRAQSTKMQARNLSGGNQQKVVLARMLATECDLLIFDEPTRGIDVGAKQEIYSLMRELADQGKGVIMISSDMPELVGMSDRIIVMSNGYLVSELNRSEYNQEIIMEHASSKLTMEA